MRPLPEGDFNTNDSGVGRYWYRLDPATFHRVGEQFMTPSPIWLHAEGEDGAPDLKILIEVVAGVPRVTEHHLERREGGREVQAKDLAPKDLESKVALVVALTSFRLQQVGDDLRFGDFDYLGANPAEVLQTRISDAYAVRRANRRPPSEDHLRRVADVYNEQMHGGLKAVMQVFDMPKSTAARRIRAARELGLIEERGEG